jgi:hypothetical protein
MYILRPKWHNLFSQPQCSWQWLVYSTNLMLVFFYRYNDNQSPEGENTAHSKNLNYTSHNNNVQHNNGIQYQKLSQLISSVPLLYKGDWRCKYIFSNARFNIILLFSFQAISNRKGLQIHIFIFPINATCPSHLQCFNSIHFLVICANNAMKLLCV